MRGIRRRPPPPLPSTHPPAGGRDSSPATATPPGPPASEGGPAATPDARPCLGVSLPEVCDILDLGPHQVRRLLARQLLHPAPLDHENRDGIAEGRICLCSLVILLTRRPALCRPAVIGRFSARLEERLGPAAGPVVDALWSACLRFRQQKDAPSRRDPRSCLLGSQPRQR